MEKGKIDYQVPVTHLKGAKGDGGNRRYASSKQWDQKEMECDRREIEIYWEKKGDGDMQAGNGDMQAEADKDLLTATLLAICEQSNGDMQAARRKICKQQSETEIYGCVRGRQI